MKLDRKTLKRLITKCRLRRETLKRLETERRLRDKKAAKKLLAGDFNGAKRERTRADLCANLLAPAKRRKNFWWIVFFAILFIMLCTLRCSTDIWFELEAENITLTLAKDWSNNRQSVSNEFVSDKIIIDNIAEVRAPAFNIPKAVYPEEESTILEVSGKDVILNEFALESGKKVELNFRGNALKFYINGMTLEGKLFFVHHADLMLETDDGEIIIEGSADPDLSEIIEFRSAIAEPVLLELFSKTDWKLNGLQAKEIGFLQEVPPNSRNFRSTIHSGKVIVLEAAKEKALHKGDCLILKGVRSRRIDISSAKNGMKISFEGSVSEILAGPRGFERNLTLTWMEWLYNRQMLFISLLVVLSFLGKNFFLGE